MVVVLVGGGVAAYEMSIMAAPRPVTFMLDFVASGFHGLFYYGVDHGTYSQNGLQVSIMPGAGSSSAIAAVSTGQVDFAFVDVGTLALARVTSNVTNVRDVATVYQVTPFAIIYNKAKISSLSDLDGKTMGVQAGSGALKLFQILCRENGLNYSSISQVTASPSTYVNLVALGQVDFILATVNRLPALQPLAAQNGISLGEFRYADYGLPVYGNAIVTSLGMIETHPDVVQSFVKGVLASVQGAARNPGEAAASVVAANPSLNSTLSREELEAVVGFSLPANINATLNSLSLGWIDPNRMQTTVDTVLTGYGVTTTLNATEIYTDQFVVEPPAS